MNLFHIFGKSQEIMFLPKTNESCQIYAKLVLEMSKTDCFGINFRDIKLWRKIKERVQNKPQIITILTIAGLVSSIASIIVLEICKAITEESNKYLATN